MVSFWLKTPLGFYKTHTNLKTHSNEIRIFNSIVLMMEDMYQEK